MLDDLYNILTNTKDQTQCKVVQILAELAKVGEYLDSQIYPTCVLFCMWD